MSARNRSRSPHFRRHAASPKPPLSPKSDALWRQRRQVAEKEDYDQRKLSPARLSPYRSISPVSRNQELEKGSWAEEEEIDDDDIYLDRHERAMSGLDDYKKQFKKFTPMANKENITPVIADSPFETNASPVSPKRSNSYGGRHGSGGKNSQNRPRSRNASDHRPTYKPRPVAIEEDPDVLVRRQKDVDYGKNQPVYAEYLQNVEKSDRTDMQPWTPDKYEKMTRRNWDKQVKIWRKQLHYWREPKSVTELMTPGTSPCPSPHRRRSPPRFLRVGEVCCARIFHVRLRDIL